MLKFDFKTFNNVVDDINYKTKIHTIRKNFNSSKKNFGWYDIDKCITKKEIDKIKKVSNYIQKNADILIVIASGAAYLNSKCIIDSLKPIYDNSKPEIIYIGNSLSSDYLRETLEYVQDKEIALNVISSNGNTIETNLIFDVFYELMEAKYENKELKKRIIITTDSKEGRLRKLTKEKGFVSFPIKKNIPEKFSIMTTIGLLPMCVFGISIEDLIAGYKHGKKYEDKAYIYAVLKDILYNQKRIVECLTIYEPKLESFTQWIQMLFACTQGKKNKGILPIKALNTDYLNVLGQFIQKGNKILFETVIAVLDNTDIKINDKPLSKINHLAMLNVAKAHKTHTPSNIITMSKLDEKNLGELIYFIMMSAVIGAYLMEVDPFDESGTNKYKKLLIESIGEL